MYRIFIQNLHKIRSSKHHDCNYTIKHFSIICIAKSASHSGFARWCSTADLYTGVC